MAHPRTGHCHAEFLHKNNREVSDNTTLHAEENKEATEVTETTVRILFDGKTSVNNRPSVVCVDLSVVHTTRNSSSLFEYACAAFGGTVRKVSWDTAVEILPDHCDDAAKTTDNTLSHAPDRHGKTTGG